MFQPEILQAVVEEKRVGFEFLDRVAAAVYAIDVHEDDDIFQIIRQHVGLVAGREGIEQE